jgi:uncharacterized protein (TIGR03435 family)
MDIAEYPIHSLPDGFTVELRTKTLRIGSTMNMMRTANIAVWVVLGAATAFAQATPRPEFEVATIRPSGPSPQAGVAAGVRLDGAQVRCAYLTLKDYIGIAYRTKLYQISGPDWLGAERFDIAATFPPGSSMAQFTEMLKSLIEDRFKLKVHLEKKDFPVYVLEVAKGGLKIQESAPSPEAEDARAPINITGGGNAQGVSINLGRGSSYTFANNKFEAKKISMTVLAANLERFVDRPIVDITGQPGNYDLALDVTPEDYRAMLIRAGVNAGVSLPAEALRLLDGATIPSLFDAMQKAGLRLDARKAPLDLLVIDDARKTPTDN